MTIKSATVWIDPQTRMIAVRTPYDTFVVAAIKQAIPFTLRQWDKTRKIWLVDQSQMDALQKLMSQLGYNVEDGTLPQESTPQHAASPYHDLLADLSIEVLRKVYRIIAMECHPDRGGSHDLMLRINEAWTKIQEAKR